LQDKPNTFAVRRPIFFAPSGGKTNVDFALPAGVDFVGSAHRIERFRPSPDILFVRDKGASQNHLEDAFAYLFGSGRTESSPQLQTPPTPHLFQRRNHRQILSRLCLNFFDGTFAAQIDSGLSPNHHLDGRTHTHRSGSSMTWANLWASDSGKASAWVAVGDVIAVHRRVLVGF